MKTHKILALCLAGILQVGFNYLYASPSPWKIQTVDEKFLTVKGKVLDSNGESLIGVNVSVKDTSNGTVTDISGEFAIQAKVGDVLLFSYIGFKNQEVIIKGDKPLEVFLNEDSEMLDEVIVTGYGSVSKKNLTTSIAKISAADIAKTGTTNMSQMLMGRAAGLQATVASAQPGGGVNITIRGGGTPIYVVDGVVMPSNSLEGNSGGSMTVMPSSVNRSGLAGLNPEDIESIEVLKDASASIYGIGAANGVILITTKKGKEGKVRISYDGSMSLVKNYPYMNVLNAQDYMMQVNAFKLEQYMYNNGMGVYGKKTYDNGNTDAFSASDISSAQTTNWKDLILRDGSISSHNVTVQGGTEKLSYYMSGNYYRQIGTVQNSGYERFTLRSNVAAQLLDFLKLTTVVNYNKNNNNNSTVGGSTNGRAGQAGGALAAALSYPSYLPVYQEDGSYLTFSNIPNAVGMLDMTDRSRSDGININFTLDVDIIKNIFKAKLLYGYNKETANRDVYIPSDVYFDQMFKSRGSMQKDYRDNSTLEAMLSFNKQIGEDLTMDAVIGMGRYFNNANGMGVSYNGTNDVIGNDNISAVTGDVSQSSYRIADEKRSQFARASIGYLDKYVLSGTLRRDGTDKFFKDKKYAWFPSVSAAWKIYNEKFMKDVSWIDLLKLRASYGVTGNDNLGSSLYGSYGVFGNQILFDNNTTSHVPFYLVSKDYPNVTWEKTVMKNIGLDFSILKGHISGSLDYFWNDVTDMLGYANSDGLSMFGTYPINGGHVRRYGWDVSVNTKNIVTHNFSWNSMLTLSHYNSIWKERMPNYDYNEYQERRDEPVNALYFYRTKGIVNSDMSNCPGYQPEAYCKPGCPIILDLNGDNTITVDDIDMVNVVPALYWGLGNTFIYKNWDLDIFIYSQLGLKKYNYVYDWAKGTNLANQTMNQGVLIKDVYNSVTNPEGNLPGIAYHLASASLPGGAGTDVGYESADFVRVRNITLGYNFTPKLLGSLSKYISEFRLYVDVQNPITFTSFSGFDPEVITGGSYKADKAEYPQIRTFSFGLKLSF